MYLTSKTTGKSGSKDDAKFHDGVWLRLRTKSDEAIIGTPNRVIKAKDRQTDSRGSKIVF